MLKKIKSKLTLSNLAWVLVLGFLGYRIWPQAAAALGIGTGGFDAPDVELVTLEGDSISLADLRGQVVLVNFWATWCPPCRAEMPGFQKVYESRRDQGFTILGISTDVGGTATVKRFLDQHGITYPVAMATSNAAHAFGGVNLLPTSFLIGRNGKIRHTVRGIFLETTLAQAVDRLLAEPGPEVAP